MSCKHEGGTDQCVRYKSGDCKTHVHAKNAEYKNKHIQHARLFATNSNSGQAAEYFVAADILARGLAVTKPLNTNCADDLHFKSASGWITVQVKTARLNTRTGTLFGPSRDLVSSDVVAIVFLPTQQIRYIANKKEVPPELQTNLTILYGGASSQSSSLNRVPVATTTKSGSSSAKSSKSRAKSVAAYSKSNSAGRRPSRSGNTAKET